MKVTDKQGEDQLEYAKDFLHHDFEQSFQQMRHYDSQSWDIIKFCFGEVLIAVTAIWALYCFSEDPDNALSLASIHSVWLILIILFVSYLFVFISSYLVARNRVYYVKTARYINELRKWALDVKPYGFRNLSGYYDDYNCPRINEPKSTQLVALYALIAIGLLCFLGITIVSVMVFLEIALYYKMAIIVIGAILSYLPFYFGCIKYLKNKNTNIGKDTEETRAK